MPASPAKTFVIAGGNGFLGRVLQRHGLAAGHRVIVLARNPNLDSALPHLTTRARPQPITADNPDKSAA
jgi:uncharacterized protein YbjT (DUF2867 family)